MRTIEAWFDALYRKHAPNMRRLAARVLGDAAIAEDLVHNVFILLLAHQEEVRQYENPAGWMYITLRNQIGNELQRSERRRVVSLETVDPRDLPQEDRQNSLSEIMPGALRREEQALLVMFYERQMSHTEMAAALGCTELACRCKLHRIKKRCYDLLSREAKKGKIPCNISAAQANVYSKEA